MIEVTAADGTALCTTCGNGIAVACIELGDGEFASTFKLCDHCTNTLLINLSRKEAADNAE